MNIEEFRTHCLAVKGSEESKNIRNTVHLRTTGRGIELMSQFLRLFCDIVPTVPRHSFSCFRFLIPTTQITTPAVTHTQKNTLKIALAVASFHINAHAHNPNPDKPAIIARMGSSFGRGFAFFLRFVRGGNKDITP